MDKWSAAAGLGDAVGFEVGVGLGVGLAEGSVTGFEVWVLLGSGRRG